MKGTVVITGARAPVALHLARLFHASGAKVVLADTFARPIARATRCKAAYVRLPGPRSGLDGYAEAWSGLIDRHAPDLVVPTCEEVFHLAALRDVKRLPLPLFAPDLATLALVHGKSTFAGVAHGFGADPPPTRLLRNVGDVAALEDDASGLVFKPVWSRFGTRVLVKPSARCLAALRPTDADPWVAQDHLPGEEICSYAVAVAGRLVALQSYRPIYRAGVGAGIAFTPWPAEDTATFVAGFVAALAWTGQISFDFKRDAAGALHVIECNPRAVSGVHMFGPSDDLPGAIMEGRPASASNPRPMTLPLAMASYGLAGAIRRGDVRRWARDARRMADITSWPGEGRMIGAQLIALGEIALLAVRAGIGLQAASTRDIEWDGAPFA